VAVSDPSLTLSVRNIVLALRLPAFPSYHDLSAIRKQQVEAHLAPHALLSVAMKSFVKMLISGGMEVMAREERRRAKARFRLLTPSHVFRAASGGIVKIFLGRVGVSMPRGTAEVDAEGKERGDLSRIKMEQD
jgi:hypothetical protein